MNIVTHKTTLKLIAKKYHLSFCSIYSYYEGNAYNNNKGESLPHYFVLGGSVYELKYTSGCFNPYLVSCYGVTFAYSLKTNEPLFKCDIHKNPNQDLFYIS